MKSRYVVIAGIAVVALLLSAGLAWGGGGNRMHRDMPSDIQNMSTEQMQDLCQELHEQMGSMMDGSGMDSMMDGSGMDSMMDGSGMDSMMDGSRMDGARK